jgi:hypothetical protein
MNWENTPKHYDIAHENMGWDPEQARFFGWVSDKNGFDHYFEL